jgi:hypothetical protein
MPYLDRKGTMQTLDSLVSAAQIADRRAAAASARSARRAVPVQPAPRERVELRRAVRRDDAALVRLAQLDSAPRASGEMLVAEVDEQIVAAVPFDGGRAIADPFRPTAELVELLRARSGQLAAAGTRAPRFPRLRPRFAHLRAA